MGYALTHALYTEAKELLVKEGLSPRKAHLLGLLAKGVDLLPARRAPRGPPLPGLPPPRRLGGGGPGKAEPRPPGPPQGEALPHAQRAEAAARTEALWLAVFGRRLARLSPEEQAAFLRILRKLTEVEDA